MAAVASANRKGEAKDERGDRINAELWIPTWALPDRTPNSGDHFITRGLGRLLRLLHDSPATLESPIRIATPSEE